jgi:hypothetical protein
MDQLTPKYDQVKKRYLKKLLKDHDHITVSGSEGERSDPPQSAPYHEAAVNASQALSTSLLEPRQTDTKEEFNKEVAAAKVRGKIADLLRRSVESTRADEPSSKSSKDERAECLLATECLAQALDTLYARSGRDVVQSNAKTTDFAKINRNIQLALNTKDLYEVVGWFQEKVKHLLPEAYLTESVSAMSPRVRGGTRGTRLSFDAVRTHSEEGSLPSLQSWEDYQLFLDALKVSMKTKQAADTRGNKIEEKGKADVRDVELTGVLNALHEIGLLLMADKVREQAEYISRVHLTVQEQTEVVELMDERLVELREKVREYGRENAELEATQEELKTSLREANSARYEAAERAALLRRRCEQLQSENASQSAELSQLRRHAQSGTASSSNQRTSNAESGSRGQSRLQAFEHRLGQHTRGVLSDSDSDGDVSEREGRRKAQHSRRVASTSPARVRDRTMEQAQHYLSELERHYAAPFWIAQFNWRNHSIEEMHAAEVEMKRVQAQIEGILAAFRTGQREVVLNFLVRSGHLRQQEKERADRERSLQTAENALCCICMEAPKTVLLMPCRHLCVCEVCSQGPPSPTARSPRSSARSASSKTLKACPVCRAKVEECLKVFA